MPQSDPFAGFESKLPPPATPDDYRDSGVGVGFNSSDPFAGFGTKPASAIAAPAAPHSAAPVPQDDPFSLFGEHQTSGPPVGVRPSVVPPAAKPEDTGGNWLSKSWSWLNSPLVDADSIKRVTGWDPRGITENVSNPVLRGALTGGGELLSGLSSPLSLAFIIGSLGTGGLVEAAGSTALKEAGLGAADIAEVGRGSQIIANVLRTGRGPEEALQALSAEGLDAAKVTQGLNKLTASGLTPQSLASRGLMHDAGSALLRRLPGVSIAQAGNVATGIRALVDAGFAYNNIVGAALSSKRTLDALKEWNSATNPEDRAKNLEDAARFAVDAVGSGAFGALGTYSGIKTLGHFMPEAAAKLGLRNAPWQENAAVVNEFGKHQESELSSQREMELRMQELRKEHPNLKDEDLHLVYKYEQSGMSKAEMARRFNALAESAGRDVRLPVPGGEPRALAGRSPVGQLTEELAPALRAEAEKTIGEDTLNNLEGDIRWTRKVVPLSSFDEHLDNNVGTQQDLEDAGYNIKALVASIKKNGIQEPIVVGPDGIEGNHRLLAARLAGLKQVPVLEYSISEEPEALAARRNRPSIPELARKYGTTSDIEQTAIIGPDGTQIKLEGEHAQMFGVMGEGELGRVAYINDEKVVRLRPGVSRAGKELHVTLPVDGITADQAAKLRAAAGPYRYGNIILEEAHPMGRSRYIEFPTAAKINDALESLVGIKEEPERVAGRGLVTRPNTESAPIPMEDYLPELKKNKAAVSLSSGEELEGAKPYQLVVGGKPEQVFYSVAPSGEVHGLVNNSSKIGMAPLAIREAVKNGGTWGSIWSTNSGLIGLYERMGATPTRFEPYDEKAYGPPSAELKKFWNQTGGWKEGDPYPGVQYVDFTTIPIDRDRITIPPVPHDLVTTEPSRLAGRKPALSPLLTEAEKQQLSVGQRAGAFTEALRNLPAVQDFVEAAKKGEVGRFWYERSIAAFDAMRKLAPEYFNPNDADRWASVVAATSPQQGVPINLREALDFWKGWVDSGRPLTEDEILKAQGTPRKPGLIPHLTNQGSKLPNVIKALNGEDLLPAEKEKYYKVGNFAGNLRGIGRHVTNDSWMGIFGGVPEEKVPTPAFYHAMSLRTRMAAQELGWEPAQAQAAIWNFVKSLAELSGWKAAGDTYYSPVVTLAHLGPEHMSAYAQDFADIMYGDPEVRGRLAQMGVDLNELDKHLLAAPAKPTVARADETVTSESLRRSARRVAAAQQKLQGFTGYTKFTPETRFDFGANEPSRLAGRSVVGMDADQIRKEFADKPDLAAKIIEAKTVLNNHLMGMMTRLTAPAGDRPGYIQLDPVSRGILLNKGEGAATIFPGHSQNIVDTLTALRNDPFTSHLSKSAIDETLGQIKQLRDAGQPIVLVGDEQFIPHELTHVRQYQLGSGYLTKHGDVDAAYGHNLTQKAVGGLADSKGYEPSMGRAEAVAEIAAHILTGEGHATGLSEAEQAEWLGSYFDGIEKKHGAKGVLQLLTEATDQFHEQKAEYARRLAEQEPARVAGREPAEPFESYATKVQKRFHELTGGKWQGRYSPPDEAVADSWRAGKSPEEAVQNFLPKELREPSSVAAREPRRFRQTDDDRIRELVAEHHLAGKPAEYVDRVLNSYDYRRLTPDHEALAQKIHDWNKLNFDRASKAGVLGTDQWVKNYLTQIWKPKDQDNPAANRLLHTARTSGEFGISSQVAMHRTFASAFEGELLGRELAKTDPIALAAYNGQQLMHIANTRALFDRLQDLNIRASDGRPMLAPSGNGHVVTGEDGENPAAFINPNTVRSIRISQKIIDGLKENNQLDKMVDEGKIKSLGKDDEGHAMYGWNPADYANLDHPGLRKWNFMTRTPEGAKVLLKSDLLVHPEFYDYMSKRLGLEQSRIQATAIGRAALAASREAKGALLFGSPFHMTQEGLRAIMTGVSPIGVDHWSLHNAEWTRDPATGELKPANNDAILSLGVRNNLTLGPELNKIESFEESMMAGHSHIIAKIPFLGRYQNWMNDFLFHKYIPSLKARAFTKLFNDYTETYAKEGWTQDKIAKKAAEDVNNRFGGINYKAMGRSMATQDWLRLGLLAPDWLESEMRFMGSLFGEGSAIPRRDVIRMAAGLWAASRVLNYLVSGKGHYEAPFGVAWKDKDGREKIYSVRSLPGDLLHAASDPSGFMAGRIAPLVKGGSEALLGTDERGHKIPPSGMTLNLLRQVAPIPLQTAAKAASGEVPDISTPEQIVKGLGGTVTPYRTEAEKTAAQVASSHSEQGVVDPAQLRRHQALIEFENRIRSGQMGVPDLNQLVMSGQLAPRQAKEVITNVKNTAGMDPDQARLWSQASRAPMADFLRIYSIATPEEKSTLSRLLIRKRLAYIKHANQELTPQERAADPTLRQLQRLFPTSPVF